MLNLFIWSIAYFWIKNGVLSLILIYLFVSVVFFPLSSTKNANKWFCLFYRREQSESTGHTKMFSKWMLILRPDTIPFHVEGGGSTRVVAIKMRIWQLKTHKILRPFISVWPGRHRTGRSVVDGGKRCLSTIVRVCLFHAQFWMAKMKYTFVSVYCIFLGQCISKSLIKLFPLSGFVQHHVYNNPYNNQHLQMKSRHHKLCEQHQQKQTYTRFNVVYAHERHTHVCIEWFLLAYERENVCMCVWWTQSEFAKFQSTNLCISTCHTMKISSSK